MKQSLFIWVVLAVALAISILIYAVMLPDFIKKGGPLVVLLLVLSMMAGTFIFERIFSLKKAEGRGSLTNYLKSIQAEINKGNIAGAIAACDKQRGSCANIIRAGLDRYQLVNERGDADQKEVMQELRASIDEAMMIEVPLLEKNLVALSTIASISTLVGLLGTVIGMIRAFKALAHAGAPDAIQLSVGISEALINTAGGLIAAISAIVAYNFFTTKVDNFTYLIDEASYNIVQALALKTPGGRVKAKV